MKKLNKTIIKAVCLDNLELPFIIGKEYDIDVRSSHYPLSYRIEDETGEISGFSRSSFMTNFRITYIGTEFKFGK